MSDLSLDGLYDGLQALANSAFPKKCNTCGRTFENAEEFVLETEKLRPRSLSENRELNGIIAQIID